ncbi:MAG: hypothetical protein LWX11_07525 [Firmicutes bacterium]|nr:hypothetical protein [Bacillota bacterium]
MLHAYVAWVTAHPFLSAALQFALLGTLGEVLAASARARRFALPCTWAQLGAKALAWALLGLVIKYGFIGMKAFTQGLLDKGLLPAFLGHGVGKAFAVSVFTNVFFGPQMMLFHRLEDNLILGQKGFHGIEKAWWTLLWFWIPAHTLTFSLPVEFQIGLAALWGLVLGLILGMTKPKK